MMKVAIVTGGNRGLGLECVKRLARGGYTVVMTARDPEKGKQAAAQVAAENLACDFLPLDVASSDSIRAFVAEFEKRYDRLDALVNNAGIFIDDSATSTSAFDVGADLVERTFRTNAVGAYELCQQLIPIMKRNNCGCVVNVSSGMGQLSEMSAGYPAYRMSKAAMNAVTKVFAEECKDTNIRVNSVCPGWVKTEMGGPNATRTLEQGAKSILFAATLPDDGPTGGFFRDGKPLAW